MLSELALPPAPPGWPKPLPPSLGSSGEVLYNRSRRGGAKADRCGEGPALSPGERIRLNAISRFRPLNRSADWQSAVSPTGSRLDAETVASAADYQSALQRNASLRYGGFIERNKVRKKEALKGNTCHKRTQRTQKSLFIVRALARPVSARLDRGGNGLKPALRTRSPLLIFCVSCAFSRQFGFFVPCSLRSLRSFVATFPAVPSRLFTFCLPLRGFPGYHSSFVPPSR